MSPEGKTLASYGRFADLLLRLWNVPTGRERFHFAQLPNIANNGDFGVGVCFAPDGQTLAVANLRSSHLELRDVATGKVRRILEGDGWTDALAFSPTSSLLAVAKSFHRNGDAVDLWDVPTGRLVHTLAVAGGRGAGFSELAFTPDGRFLVGSDRQVIYAWEMASRQQIFRLRKPAVIRPLAFTPGGRLLGLVGGGATDLFDFFTGKRLHRLRLPEGAVCQPAISPDGRLLALPTADTTVLIFPLPDLDTIPENARRLEAREMDRLWRDLAGERRPVRRSRTAKKGLPRPWGEVRLSVDGHRAYKAIQALAASPGSTLPFLKNRLQRRPPPKWALLVEKLGSNQFAVREAAQGKLAAAGSAAELPLRAALRNQLALELRRRIEQLLAPLEKSPPPPELLRQVRAVQVFEQVGTAEARAILVEFAQGEPEARLTREARASLQRLKRRQRAADRPFGYSGQGSKPENRH
jgi:WD40 repeat protein